MSDPVTLLMPSEERFRQLAADVARKFIQIAGGSATDGTGLGGEVQAAIERLAADRGAGADVELGFKVAAAGIEIHLRCGTSSAVVTKAVPARET